MDLLEQALDRRSRVFLRFSTQIRGIGDINCSLAAATEDGVVLETDTLQAAGRDWEGRRVACWFSLTRRAKRIEEIFYNFNTVIKEASLERPGLVRLTLRPPDRVDTGQRRKSLRVDPNMDMFPRVFVWTYDARGAFQLDRPILTRASFENRAAMIKNLSGGGMRLMVARAALRDHDVDLVRGDRLIVLLNIRDRDKGLEGEHWLAAKINHAYEDRVTRNKTLGLEFTAHGKADSKTRKVTWKKVVDNVISELADATFHWHVDKLRNTPG